MRIIIVIFIAAVFSSTVVWDAHSEYVLDKEVSEDVLRKRIRNKYLGKIEKVELMQKKVLKYNESKYGVNSVETLKFLEALAWMNMEQQDFKEAGQFYLRVIKIRGELLPRSDDNIEELGVAHFKLGDIYLYQSQYVRAIASYDESMSFATNHGNRGDTLNRKGIASEGLKDYEKAVEIYLDALKEYDTAKTLNPENTKLIDKRVLIVYKRLSELYHKLGENKKVKEYQVLIKDIKKQNEKE